MKSLRSLCSTLLLSVSLTLAACGGDAAPDKVAYQDTTLIVNGVRYERQQGPTNGGNYVPHHVLVHFKPGRFEEGVKLLNEFGLPPTSVFRHSEGALITVPAGFEAQWAAALMSLDAVQTATRDVIVTHANAVEDGALRTSPP